ncbi:Aminomethyltransferase folate-binding domain-containing protein [Cryphonectria parasitica EP155]|uniref:Iron-sulfur cluster assembly factor IBA57 homolog, mitochondrial n=1 Tax=Cryphonectria parasitica (strain ATCC 38755 / EP155) TaxID=660469 RepID=A0A9P4YC71_CRYP1|nr:Aminomethyltransferase folate-binding domain-containing protein [Cryphonectria parasitica EP155]KAF3770381.1 Aminomethyltransferase folate-binding domain-containing protein [Cryphonectria parasitica EP155]
MRPSSMALPTAAAAPPPPPSSGLIALSSRRLLSISGPDAPKFLQGVITQNILAPQAGSASTAHKIRTDGFYGAFLTATGRVLYDVFIYPDTRSSLNPTATTTTATAAAPGESFLVEVDADEAARLERHIKRYKLRAKFTVRLLDRQEATVWHAWDEDGRAALDATAGQGVEDYHRLVHMRDPRAPGLGWRMVKAGDREPLVDLARVAAGGDKEEEDVYRVRRYLLGVPEGQKELLRETALPLEGNLDVMGGIDFRKGCYVGQELTIRTKHRGVVRKRVLPVVVYGAEEEEEEEEEEEAAPQALEYRAGGPVDASSIPVDTSIGRLEKKGRSAGKWLRGVGNVGLALCRLEIMTDVVLPGETAAASYNPAGEFVMETQPGEDGEGGASKVKIKAFVPDWLRQRLDEQNSGHGQP